MHEVVSEITGISRGTQLEIENCYWRQSALRTIKGGICWGLGLRRVLLTQLRLLGYQRIVKG